MSTRKQDTRILPLRQMTSRQLYSERKRVERQVEHKSASKVKAFVQGEREYRQKKRERSLKRLRQRMATIDMYLEEAHAN